MGQLFTASCPIDTPTGANMTLDETERRAYVSGDSLVSSLLLRILELEEELRKVQDDNDFLTSEREDRYGAADAYIEFFRDCASAAGIPDARIDADHDLRIILEAIRDSELCWMHHGLKRGEE
jgi:hypothetical protein